MKEIITGLRKSLQSFLTNYALADIATATPVYQIAEFDPEKEDDWKRVNKITDYGFIIHGITDNNEAIHPHSHLKIRFHCEITIARKTAKLYDVTNRLNFVAEGTTGLTSIYSVKTNLMKWLRASYLDESSATREIYWADVRSTGQFKRIGDYNYVTVSYEALRMETKTITYA